MQNFRVIAVALLALCFVVSGTGAAYSACKMNMTQNDSSMTGCHDGAVIPKQEKKCCFEMACPKCFSQPTAFMRFAAVSPAYKVAFYTPPDKLLLKLNNPARLERPPKA